MEGMEIMDTKIIAELIGKAIEKHGCAISPTKYNTFNEAITVQCGLIMLWYDIPCGLSFTSGVVTMEVV